MFQARRISPAGSHSALRNQSAPPASGMHMNEFLTLERSLLGAVRPLAHVLDAVPWNEAGLIAAVAQQHDAGDVLMLA